MTVPTALLLVAVFALVALVDGPVTALVVSTALWGVLDRRRRRPRPPRLVAAPEDRPGWGYEFPWVDLPGMAYVGVTKRAPVQLEDGTWWLDRWDDVGHPARRGDVDMARSVIYEFTSMAEAEVWETRRIVELAVAGHTLLNVDKNPGRPCWERLDLAA